LKEDHELSKCENDEIKNLIIKEKDNYLNKRKFEMVDFTSAYLYSNIDENDDKELNVKDGEVVGNWNNKKKNNTTQACTVVHALVGDHENGKYNSDVGNIKSSPRFTVVPGNRTDHILMMLELKDERVDLSDVINYIAGDQVDPTNLEEAMRSKDHFEWEKAMANEYENLLKRGVLKEVIPPPGEVIKEIDSKLVFKKKIKNNKIFKYKVRLCARGFTQSPIDDYNETYAPVARTNSLRIFIKISIIKNHMRKWMDVVAAYLYGLLNETLYLKPPQNWKCKPNHKLLLIKALYGTKQAGRSWYQLSKDFMINELGLIMCISDNCIFYNKNFSVMILIYVDDILTSYQNEEEYQIMLNKIKSVFEIG
jgi:hypothetical protein